MDSQTSLIQAYTAGNTTESYTVSEFITGESQKGFTKAALLFYFYWMLKPFYFPRVTYKGMKNPEGFISINVRILFSCSRSICFRLGVSESFV